VEHDKRNTCNQHYRNESGADTIKQGAHAEGGKISIIEIKELFLSKWKTFLSNGVHETMKQSWLEFLYKLDKGRYGQMMVP